MSDDSVLAVQDKPPPAVVLKVMNPIVTTLLRSPLHRAVSRNLMLLHVTGTKTGRMYVVPVGRHEVNGRLLVSAGGAWRRNLKNGADLDVTLDGRRRPAHGVLVEDPQEVAEIFAEMLNELGLNRANRLGLQVNVDRAPAVEELRVALVNRNVVRLTLT